MTQIFVGNLSYQASDADVRSAFERFGRVTSVRLPTDRISGNGRGIAFVTMTQFEDAEEAIARLNGSTLAGRTIIVNEARERGSKLSPNTPVSTTPSRFHLV